MWCQFQPDTSKDLFTKLVHIKGRKLQSSEKNDEKNKGKNCPKKPKIGLKSIFVLVKVGPTWIRTAYRNSGC